MPRAWFHETEEIRCWESTRSREYFKNLSYVCAIFQRPDLWEIIWRVGWVRPRLGRKQPASQCRKYAKVNGACADPRRVWAQTGFQEGWWAGRHSNPGSLDFSVWPSSLIPCRLDPLMAMACQNLRISRSRARGCPRWAWRACNFLSKFMQHCLKWFPTNEYKWSSIQQHSILSHFSGRVVAHWPGEFPSLFLFRSADPKVQIASLTKETQVARALLSHAMVSASRMAEMLVPRNRVKDRTKNRIQRTE